MIDVDLTDPAFVADPYPVLAELRAQGPMLWHEQSQRWLATTHDAVSAVLRDRKFGRIWSDWEPVDEMEPFNTLHRNQMMENEPPAHTRLRRLVAGAFGRGHVERMRPRVEAIVQELLDALDTTRPVDIMAEFAEPLPVRIICEMLGVPSEDHEQLRDWSQAIVHMYEQGIDDSVKHAATTASTQFAEYVRQLIVERKENPGEDLVSHLIAERDGEGKLNDDELIASVVLLLNAGHEASVNTFGNGFYALMTHRDQLERMTSQEVPINVALEELIRFDAPLQLFERTATADIEVAGVTVNGGQKVACLMGSANRDAATFADPDTFDVSRNPNPHVGFGMGVHFCLGAPLARMELAESFAGLLRRFPKLDLAGQAPRRLTWVLRGFEKIEVAL